MELAGVLGVCGVAVFVRYQTTDNHLDDRFSFRCLRKVTVVAGDDNEGLLRLRSVTKTQGSYRVAT
jgi:hypothetical protein